MGGGEGSLSHLPVLIATHLGQLGVVLITVGKLARWWSPLFSHQGGKWAEFLARCRPRCGEYCLLSSARVPIRCSNNREPFLASNVWHSGVIPGSRGEDAVSGHSTRQDWSPSLLSDFPERVKVDVRRHAGTNYFARFADLIKFFSYNPGECCFRLYWCSSSGGTQSKSRKNSDCNSLAELVLLSHFWKKDNEL